MEKVTMIMFIASLGYILIGVFVMKSKTIKISVAKEDNDEKSKEFINKNSSLNITVGIIGLVLSTINLFNSDWSKILIILFVSLIFIASLIQYFIGKKYKEDN